MSEVKGNSNLSTTNDGLIHPTSTAIKNPEKPLETSATTLHPLPKNQPVSDQNHTPPQTSQPPVVAKTNIQFNSAVGSKNSQKIDPFAEQNAKQAEKKKQRAKKRKNITLYLVVIGVILVVSALSIWLIPKALQSNPKDPETQTVIADNTYNEAMDTIKNSTSDNQEDKVNEATQVFNQAIDKANKENNPELADALRIAQMRMYLNTGQYDDRIIELGEQINNINQLSPIERIKYYNFLAQSYSSKGDNEQAQKYYRLAAEASTEMENYGG